MMMQRRSPTNSVVAHVHSAGLFLRSRLCASLLMLAMVPACQAPRVEDPAEGRINDTNDDRIETTAVETDYDDGAQRSVSEREVHHRTTETRSMRGFVVGVLLTVLALAIAIGAYLVVSDDDDDGNLDIEVPAVDVDAP